MKMMTRKPMQTAFALMLTLIANTWGTTSLAEDETIRPFPLEGFDRVDLKGNSNLNLFQGDSFEVIAVGPAAALKDIRARVRGDTLELGMQTKHRHSSRMAAITDEQAIHFNVTLPEVSAIQVSGSGKALADTIESSKLALRVTGSGELTVAKVATDSLSAKISGTGNLTLGTVLMVTGEASITGTGDLHLDSLAGESLAARIKGTGDILINGRVSKLAVGIMGSGDFIGRNLVSDSAVGSTVGSGEIILRRPKQQSFSSWGSGDIVLVD
ncbi:GIN domain-containing protein [Microbulbifer sp. 2201CG32-9]|uniref:GIN domain-containing protein n=1 Tax=Microbulbifer sp. 2201CG32-9 TaxID=3232309 RepID=UPI00345BAF01